MSDDFTPEQGPMSAVPPGWPRRWWEIYTTLHELWSAGRYDESETLLRSAMPEFGHLPTAKLAQARQLADTVASRSGIARARAIKFVEEGVGDARDDPQVLMTALLIAHTIADERLVADYVARLGPHGRELHPKDSAALLYITGGMLMRLDRRDEAEEFLRIAVEADPDEPQYWLGLAENLSARALSVEALQTVRRALRRFPSDPDLLRYEADLRRGDG